MATNNTEAELTIALKNACKHYGSSKNPIIVLKNLNMRVKKGTIYGILGASGCGKTTLLNCIVGEQKLDSGDITVLGNRPGARGSDIPGNRVGYMPQELALYEYLTIKEILTFFGWIYHMELMDIKTQRLLLHELMCLPNENQLVQNLSGGQMRRVSFACALMHDPELLILDEPTVGLDPVLRESIWKHLSQLVKAGDKTILLTTHYIEEATQANTVGLMRNHYLLAEDSPANLMRLHMCDTLENVFLKLCVLQKTNILSHCSQNQITYENGTGKEVTVNNTQEDFQEVDPDNTSKYPSTRFHDSGRTAEMNEGIKEGIVEEEINTKAHKRSLKKKNHKNNIMIAIFLKHLILLWRHPSIIVFVLIIPIIEVCAICLSIGNDPRNVKLAIFNSDVTSPESKCPRIFYSDCVTTDIGCQFINHLSSETFSMEFYSSLNDALDTVLKGQAWSVIYFPENFSEALVKRYQGIADDDAILYNSTLQVLHDSSNRLTNDILVKHLLDDYKDFTSKWTKMCGLSTKHLKNTLKFEEPVFGSNSLRYLDTITPGLVALISFFFGIPLAITVYLQEKGVYTWERNIVAGITKFDMVLPNYILSIILLLIQGCLMIIFVTQVFDLENKGNYGLIILLITLQGICGLSIGVAISMIVAREDLFIQIVMGLTKLFTLTCGIIWPVEGMDEWLRYISYVLPITFTARDLRNVMFHGQSISEANSYYGLSITIAYIIISWIIILFRLKQL